MRNLRSTVLLFLFVALPTALLAGVDDLPDTTQWYIHVDFDQMRDSDAGAPLYAWLKREAFEDIREDAGVDIDTEADAITAWGAADNQVFVVVDGDISQTTKDRLVALGAASGSMDLLGSGRDAYYHVKGDGEYDEGKIQIDSESFEDGAYFSVAVPNKLIVASSEAGLKSLIGNGGRPKKSSGDRGALFVLRAERNLMQAGVKAGEFGEDFGWDSNIFRNAEQIALLVADEAGKLAVEAQLMTTEKAMADSLASIVRGLISLQAFDDDMDDELRNVLQNTQVGVDDRTLRLKLALDPQTLIATIE